MNSRICEGKVVIVTGAGRGIGRGHAIEFARQGAKVVVNDHGGETDGTGSDQSVAAQVVTEIQAMGGEAVANGDDISEWEGARRLVNTAVETFGELHVVVNNAGILRDRMLTNMTEGEWDSVIKVHLKGHIRADPLGRGLLAGTIQGQRFRGRRSDHQHQQHVGAVRQPRTGELRRGQGRHRFLDDHRGSRACPIRCDRERGFTGSPNPNDREPGFRTSA